jgi:hypothetical protein
MSSARPLRNLLRTTRAAQGHFDDIQTSTIIVRNNKSAPRLRRARGIDQGDSGALMGRLYSIVRRRQLSAGFLF